MTQVYRCKYFAKFTSDPLKNKIKIAVNGWWFPFLSLLSWRATVFRFVHILYLDHGESINNNIVLFLKL